MLTQPQIEQIGIYMGYPNLPVETDFAARFTDTTATQDSNLTANLAEIAAIETLIQQTATYSPTNRVEDLEINRQVMQDLTTRAAWEVVKMGKTLRYPVRENYYLGYAKIYEKNLSGGEK